jgi:hypothetical protein
VNIKTVLKTSVAAAALVAVAAPAVVSSAQAGWESGNKNTVTMSGQIARSLVYQDDGKRSELFNTDGVDTNTRLRWIVSGQATESVTVGGIVEMNMPLSNSTYSLGDGTGTADSAGNASTWGMRKTEITFAHKAAGKLSLGQGSSAGDGASTQTLGSWGASMSAQGVGGQGTTKFVDSSTGIATGISVSSANASYDPGRVDRVRYDTPSFGGLSLSASYGNTNGDSGIGANYGGKFGGIQVAAAAFYLRNDSTAGTDGAVGGSIAVKHDSGISAHLGYTKEDGVTGAAFEGKEWHGGIGYAAQLTNLGTTGFAVNYTRSDDTTSAGDEGTVLGVAVNQNISSVGTDVFASYSRVTYDDTSTVNYDDFSAIMVGSMLSF